MFPYQSCELKNRFRDQNKKRIVNICCAFSRAKLFINDKISMDALNVALNYENYNLELKQWYGIIKEEINHEKYKTFRWDGLYILSQTLGCTLSNSRYSIDYLESILDISNYETANNILDCFTSTVEEIFPTHIQGLIKTIKEDNDFSLMSILSDALEEIGSPFAKHCKKECHYVGCYILEE